MSITTLARPEIRAMTAYSSARSEAAAAGILLNANESPWPLVEDPMARSGEVHGLNRYPDPQHAGLLAQLARQYDIPQDHLLLTRGSDDGIDLLVRVFCRAGQDAILDTPPGFGMYQIAAQIQGASIIEVPRQAESLELDHDGVLEAVRRKPDLRIVFLTSPANPTGDLVEAEFLQELLALCADRCLVVVDEAYAEFTQAPSASRSIADHEHLVVLRTLSKAFASAGLRCGAVLAQPEVISLLKRVIPPYPLPAPVLSLAMRLFEPETLAQQEKMVREILEIKQDLLRNLADRPVVSRLWPGEGNFVLIRVQDGPVLVRHCSKIGITLRAFPGSAALENCVRISIGSRQEIAILTAALDAFESADRDSDNEAARG
jgi:histidinol-phosphate aminotransferase